jgi:putative heme-binding domain-containing protein
MNCLNTLLIICLLVSPLSSIAEDKKVDVWADTSLTQNPSYFYFDSKGRLLVTELYRIVLIEYTNNDGKADTSEVFVDEIDQPLDDLGSNLFFTNGATNYMRCHQINGQGSNVSPDLSYIGEKHSAKYLLQALIDPIATIAPGYSAFNLTIHDGSVLSGLFNSETDTTITLGEQGKKLNVFNKSEIKAIQRPTS